MADVLAVIVSYGNPYLSGRAMGTLKSQKGVTIKVVVWDNFSTEGNLSHLRKLVTDEILVESPNVLWSPAINKAVKDYSDGEKFILMQNNDLSLPNVNSVATLVNLLETYEGAGLVGPAVPALGGPQDPIRLQGVTSPVRVPYLLGACTVVSRRIWDEVGPLDPDMKLGADDHDYSIRLKHYGYSLWVDPRVGAVHKGHASNQTPDGAKEWGEWGKKSWARFDEKWAGYFANEEEAVKAHWAAVFDPDFIIGTGWSEETYDERIVRPMLNWSI